MRMAERIELVFSWNTPIIAYFAEDYERKDFHRHLTISRCIS
jgi:hypothetical protein